MEFDQVFNLFEGIFWISISAILFTRVRRAEQHRDLLLVGGGAFLLFGIFSKKTFRSLDKRYREIRLAPDSIAWHFYK